MERFRYLAAIAALFLCHAASAQFDSAGDDPGRTRWSEVETDHYRVIYPRAPFRSLLSDEYARELERVRDAVGRSVGYYPGGLQWGKKTPVILHQSSIYSNGSVSWAPRTINLYTIPDPYDALPYPWHRHLIVHEIRHHAQMQLAYDGLLRPVNWIVGELWPGAVSALYPNRVLLEGDAVVAETALTPSGRGRNASFMNYYQVAFDEGDFRDYYKWQYGSFRNYSPDFYSTGYMLVSGLRCFYDRPLVMAEYFDAVARRPFRLGNIQRTARSASGKSFKETFLEIEKGYHSIWTREAEERAPFIPMERLTPEPKFATDYAHAVAAGDRIYVVKRGKLDSPRLVGIDGKGKETDFGPWPSVASSFVYDGQNGRFYFSETRIDPRWSLAGTSVIRYFSTEDHRAHDLTKGGRLFNPHPFRDGERVAAGSYPEEGGTDLVILDAGSGAVIETVPSPEGVQLLEPAYLRGTIYCIGISDDGAGIWRLEDDEWEIASAPSYKQMFNLEAGEDWLRYVSDLDGSNELYCFFPETGKTFRMTSLRYGGTDFTVARDTLCYSSMTRSGLALFRTPLSALSPVEADPSAVHSYPVADLLSAQEEELSRLVADAPREDRPLAEGKPYGKAGHLLKIHSWAPLCVDYDAIESLSLDFGYSTAFLGATGFFQNDLGTMGGSISYGALPEDGSWRHGAHLKLIYSGLYPVIEGSVDFNGRARYMYLYTETRYGELLSIPATTLRRLDEPNLAATLKFYIPWNLSRGGVLRGLIPMAEISVSNDMYRKGAVVKDAVQQFSIPGHTYFRGYTPAGSALMSTLRFSVRGYSMLPTSSSRVYPKWGIGAEAGCFGRLALEDFFAPEVYCYLYGYLPGLAPSHGLKLTLMADSPLRRSIFPETRLSISPRHSVTTYSGVAQMRFTADYAMPFSFGDISLLSPVAYVRNFLAIPHFDLSWSGGRNFLLSYGVDLTAELSNVAWIPFDSSIGLDITRYTGVGALTGWYFGPAFSWDL